MYRNYDSPSMSSQNQELTWEERAKNILVAYNKTGTLTTALFVEFIDLIMQLKNSMPKPVEDTGGDVETPTWPEPLTAEEIRDLLESLPKDEQLSANNINDVSENVFVNVDGESVPLQNFLEYLYSQLNYVEEEAAELTREDVINLIGFEPLGDDSIVDNLDNPSGDTILSTQGLFNILEDFVSVNWATDVQAKEMTADDVAITPKNLAAIKATQQDALDENNNDVFMTPQAVHQLLDTFEGGKWTGTFGDGSATIFTFEHNLNTTEVDYKIRNETTIIMSSPTDITANTITFRFKVAPLTGTKISIWR